MTKYCGQKIQLAVAYMADGVHESKLMQGGIVYYAVDADLRVSSTDDAWEKAKEELLRVIEDFHPDIIQCFGA